jgi:hypothetical protein
MALSLVSSSPRVRWVDASSERICASEEGDDTSVAAAEAFPLGVSGRTVLVEAVGVVSSAPDAGWFAAAPRSASLVSGHCQHISFKAIAMRLRSHRMALR